MKILHALAILLFLVALCFYVVSSSTGASLIGGFGVALEIAAWGVALTSKEPTTPDGNAT